MVFTPNTSNDTVIPGRFAGLSTSAAQDVIMWSDRNTAVQSSFVPEAGTIDQFFVATTAPGGVASYAFSVFKNNVAAGSPGNLTTTVTGTSTTGSDVTDSISVVDADFVQFHSVPSGTPAAATVAYGARFRPSTSGDFLFFVTSAAADSAASTVFLPISGSIGTQITTESTAQSIANSMTVTKMEVQLSSAPGFSSASKTFTPPEKRCRYRIVLHDNRHCSDDMHGDRRDNRQRQRSY